jgi:N-acetylglutamate synthase-like GNAT family acetyltransferase
MTDDAYRFSSDRAEMDRHQIHAWLCDVFVDPAVRGRGVGVALIENVGAALDALNLRRVALATSSAHGLYAKFGFETVASPDHWMERRA